MIISAADSKKLIQQIEDSIRNLKRNGGKDAYFNVIYYTEESDLWYNDSELAHFMGDYVVDVSRGASKTVLFMRDFPNIVVKIPMIGELYYTEDEDDFVDWEDEYDVENYHSAELYDEEDDDCSPIVDCDWNYCEVETQIYKIAKELNVQMMLAETDYLCDIFNHPVYIAERCDVVPNYRGRSNSSIKEYRDNAYEMNKITDRNSRITYDDYLCFIEGYGISAAWRIAEFISRFKIYDLHSNNFGYDRNGKIKIIDYSDFNG